MNDNNDYSFMEFGRGGLRAKFLFGANGTITARVNGLPKSLDAKSIKGVPNFILEVARRVAAGEKPEGHQKYPVDYGLT